MCFVSTFFFFFETFWMNQWMTYEMYLFMQISKITSKKKTNLKQLIKSHKIYLIKQQSRRFTQWISMKVTTKWNGRDLWMSVLWLSNEEVGLVERWCVSMKRNRNVIAACEEDWETGRLIASQFAGIAAGSVSAGGRGHIPNRSALVGAINRAIGRPSCQALTTQFESAVATPGSQRMILHTRCGVAIAVWKASLVAKWEATTSWS